MRIVLDAMGTDEAPRAEVAGAVEALEILQEDTEVVLVGDRDEIETELRRHGPRSERLSIHHAPERVTADDPPASVLRRKPDSSIVIGLRMHGAGEADAFVSAGSTGAVMATSLFVLKPLPGVARPAIGTILPTVREPCLMLDAGANVDCKPQHLVQFARLGQTYVQDLMGKEDPRIGLLNIGEEPGKGDELTIETHRRLSEQAGLNFVGNVEGRDLIGGVCDVVVCDGFVGNVLLKFFESVAGFIVSLLRKELGQVGSGDELERVFRVLDYAEYGGAPLLGVGGVPIICHGGSPPKAIRNALLVAARAVRSGMVGHSASNLSDSADAQEQAT